MRRSSENPILTRHDIPDVPPDVVDVTSVFNPGAIRVGDRYALLLRVQTRGRETVLMAAESEDGEHFAVRPSLVKIDRLDAVDETIYHIYDPRLTRIGDVMYMMFAADVDGACRLGIATGENLDQFRLVSFGSDIDTRNGVLFPEKIGGRFVRLERPNLVAVDGGVSSGSEIILAESDDLVTWNPVGSVMNGRPHYWDELIGSGPPPVKTRDGWLHIYHGIARHFGAGIYQAGAVLLDLQNPCRVVARSRCNILEPRELYEMVGQVPNVVFPGGMIVDDIDSEGFAAPGSTVRVYYGAADTCVGLALTTIDELLAACHA
ncbi:MAG: glycoside hydrolase family 130 protein [Phycisphaerales bacterium]|nr:glycoside hydrolase family 130 protein [Phycisphaerales bacterium]